MTKILNKNILTVLAVSFVSACSWLSSSDNVAYESNYLVQPLVKNPTSVVVCRDKQCAPARLSMSREYIYNSLLQLLQNNKGAKALICTADSASHVCTEEYLVMPLKVGITPARMYIDDVKITDVKVAKGEPKMDLVLNYNVTYNGQTPDCRPAKTMAFVESVNSIMMEDSGYECKMTAVSHSTVRTMFAVDYIDLDYGYIGGYYSIGVSGPANGGGAGYMLLRLPTNAYPLSPALQGFEDKNDEKEVKETEPADEGNVVPEAENEAPAETPAENRNVEEAEPLPVEAPVAETPAVEAPAETPVAAPIEAPVAAPAKTPTDVLVESMATLPTGGALNPSETPAYAPTTNPMVQPVMLPYQPTLFEPVANPVMQPVPMEYQLAPQILQAPQPVLQAPQPVYGAPIPVSGQVVQVDICNGSTANIYPGVQVQEVCNGVPVQVVPEPALRPEVMVEPQPNMSLQGPAAVNGKPVTKTVVEDASEISKKPSKVEVFPIYTKKSISKKEAPSEEKPVEASSGDSTNTEEKE